MNRKRQQSGSGVKEEMDPWDDQPNVEAPKRSCERLWNVKDNPSVDFALDQFDPGDGGCGLGNLRDRRPLFQRLGSGVQSGSGSALNNAAFATLRSRSDAAGTRRNFFLKNDPAGTESSKDVTMPPPNVSTTSP